MRAVVYERYGPPEVLHLAEVPTPEPRPDEVRVRVHAAGVSMSDHYIRSLDVPWVLWLPIRVALGFFRPRRHIPGIVYSGVVDRVGAEITKLAPGDAVYGMTGFDFGAYAEYKCLRTKDGSKTGCIALKPGNVSHEEATVAAYGGLLALQAIDHARIEAGDRVLIYGGSGTSGTMAIQIAKAMGAHVTAVAGTDNQALVRSLGADASLDYRTTERAPEGERFDVFLDCAGKRRTSALREDLVRTFHGTWRTASIDDGDVRMDSACLDRIRALVESGAVKPVLGQAWPMEQIVDAHRALLSGHKRGGYAVSIVH
ncbi:MAG: NAD(P)-dependent alcohol dehydrogenase [Sandaracinaceae bacterium]